MLRLYRSYCRSCFDRLSMNAFATWEMHCMSEPELLFEKNGAIARVTFNRPEARNAMTWAMYDGLVEACERVDSDPDVRVVILCGAGGKAFVAGTDISQFQTF